MTDTIQTQNPAEKNEVQASFPARVVAEGDVVTGRVVKITGNVAFIDYGAASEGYIELSEFKDASGALTLAEGDEIEAAVVETRGAIRLSAKKIKTNQVLETIKAAFEAGEPVQGEVVNVNKGGFEVRIQGHRAFCPASQFAERFVRDTKGVVGKTYDFRIIEFGDGKSIVVSRKVLLEAAREERQGAISEAVSVGERRQGTVTRLAEFGAFVDLGGGLEGLIHISEISHERINHPKERLSVGDAIEVKVVRVEAERERVALSIKALEDDPWSTFAKSLKRGQRLSGKVERLQPFGAFVNIAPGIDGLLHVSAITRERRIEHPKEVLEVGQEIEVIVDRVEMDKKRIGLMSVEVGEQRAPAPSSAGVKVGELVKGTVSRVEGYGVFLEIAPRVVGLIPNGEMGTERGANHAQLFPVGTELEVKVIDIDTQRNRIRLSRKALKYHAEEEAFSEYRKQQRDTNQSMGTFGDLLKNFLTPD
ncbi:S1 RNA-binding domain-containing protein [Myxococcota bacterium]|nr:S1 RNA-binding domain-containing protein [Myxococcota bacterium]MBU1432429.1 S1 RNA-binding domain-containing protein [Myxococcota bacterium]